METTNRMVVDLQIVGVSNIETVGIVGNAGGDESLIGLLNRSGRDVEGANELDAPRLHEHQLVGAVAMITLSFWGAYR